MTLAACAIWKTGTHQAQRGTEQAFARGERVLAVMAQLRKRHALDHAKAPSVRTMRRWFSQGRGLRLPSQLLFHPH